MIIGEIVPNGLIYIPALLRDVYISDLTFLTNETKKIGCNPVFIERNAFSFLECSRADLFKIIKQGDSLTENHKTMIKSTFLLVSAPDLAGMKKLTLRDVNGGEGVNDFRSGAPNGAAIFDVFAADFVPEPGATYLLTLEKYVEPASTIDENSDNGSATAEKTDAVLQGPQSFIFNDQLSLEVDNGNATLQVFGNQLTATAESEENTDTQVNTASEAISDSDVAKSNANTGNDGLAATESNISSIVETASNDNQGAVNNESTGPENPNPDTNTQGNTGPASGTEEDKSGVNSTDQSNNQVV